MQFAQERDPGAMPAIGNMVMMPPGSDGGQG
jgi:hypothetical protein